LEKDKVKISKLLEDSLSGLEHVSLRSLFNDKLREHNLTERQALKLLDIQTRTAGDIIDGTAKQPNLFNVIKICDFLEIEVNDVLIPLLKNQDDL